MSDTVSTQEGAEIPAPTSTEKPAGTGRKRLFRILRFALTAGLLALVLSQVGVGQVLTTLRQANLSLFVIAIVLFQIGVMIRALRWWVLLRGSGVDAPPGEILVLQYGAQLFNVSLPTGFAGDVMRSVEFKGSGSRAASAGIVILDRIIGFTSMFLVALVALAIGHRLLDRTTALALAATIIIGLLGVAVVLQGDLPRRLTRFLPQKLSLAGEGALGRLYDALTGCSRSGLALALVISAANSIIIIVIHYLIARAVGAEIGIGPFFMITPIVNLSLLLPSVGGLGPRELGYQVLLAPLGVPGAVAVALGFGIYLGRVSNAILGALYYFLWSARR